MKARQSPRSPQLTSSQKQAGPDEDFVTWAVSPRPSLADLRRAGPADAAGIKAEPDQSPLAKVSPVVPVHDPVSDLLKKYHVYHEDEAETGQTTSVMLPHVRTPSGELIREEANRRASSCGPEWPVSRADAHKRQRRVRRKRTISCADPDAADDDAAATSARAAAAAGRAGDKQSRLAALLDRVRSETVLECTETETDGDSESEMSRVRSRTVSHAASAVSAPSAAPSAAQSAAPSAAPSPAAPSEDSDYGFDSDDIDLDMVAALEKRSASQTTPPSPKERPRLDTLPSSPTPSGPRPPPSDDEFCDDDLSFCAPEIEEMMAKLESASALQQAGAAVAEPFPWQRLRGRKFHRLMVMGATEGQFFHKGAAMRAERRVEVQFADESLAAFSALLLLRDDWYHAEVRKFDYVHVVGDFDASGQCVLDNGGGLLVVHPDYLVSSTSIADYFSCARKATLGMRVSAISDFNKAMTYGTVLHEVFQECILARDFSTPFMDACVDKYVPRHVEEFFFLEEPLAAAKAYVRDKFGAMQDWVARYYAPAMRPDAVITDSHSSDQRLTLSVAEVLNTEEHIWSPMYGIKGSIDITVRAEVSGRGRAVVPLELKTGKAFKTVGHRAQTMLYTLMLSDKYDMDVTYGILYYMEALETHSVSAVRNEIRGMIVARNELARSARDRGELPEMLRKQFMCQRCFSATPCFVYHKALEGGDGVSSGLGDDFDRDTAHITAVHAAFLRHWEALVTLEEDTMNRFRKEIWTMTGLEREAHGRCFANVAVELAEDCDSAERISKFRYVLARRGPGASFGDSQIAVGEPVVVSDTAGHYGLAKGFAQAIGRDAVTVTVDRRLDRDTLYRVDKDEFSNGMSMIRNNLVQLLAHDGDERRRRLVVELAPPSFGPPPSAVPGAGELNGDQVHAVERALAADDYALILGMPGTGKTTTIAYLISALLAQNKTVLLTSYTHSAVDNILLKLRGRCDRVLRLGPANKIHPDVRAFATLQNDVPQDFAELKRVYFDSQIVATTCLGIGHRLFLKRAFDYCIVDEASQITLPTCVGPLRFARTFVLVGDHFQLPPLVRSADARANGLDVSLFRLLSERHPAAVVNLEHQYRMCRDIMLLSNELVYDGRLKCGTAAVAERALALPRAAAALEGAHTGAPCPPGRCWLAHVFDPAVKVVFIDTDAVPAREVVRRDRVQNDVEAGLVHQLVRALVAAGADPHDLGVISVYRSQLKLLAHRLRDVPGLELQTVDKFQGRDKECVVMSLVRSNDDAVVGDLLTDWRRLNVTFTRARSKLVLIGSRRTLQTVDFLHRFFALVDAHGWIYALPPAADAAHPALAYVSPAKPDGPVRSAVIKTDIIASRPVLMDIVNSTK
ncbi:uncharacterized protein V1510DRAFT_126073 [Dipodascopsis tothii]|uniref:uncharacterized protein n=1 Tax=Dipodascopsis tothii TaxID=44089 RepID=UPI0034CDE98E